VRLPIQRAKTNQETDMGLIDGTFKPLLFAIAVFCMTPALPACAPEEAAPSGVDLSM
jgi:hypothetical protein